MATYKRIVISRDADYNVDLIENLENPVFDEFSSEFDDFEKGILDQEIDEEEDDKIVVVYLFYPEGKLIAILPDETMVANG
jgi:hypothetical protein